MKTVLCYGDSLTWGYDAEGPGRHELANRWPSALQAGLGDSIHVIADGLNGRTTVYDDHKAECDRNGARTLSTTLQTHAPLELVILLLGTNDMKPEIAGNALLSMQGMRRLVIDHPPSSLADPPGRAPNSHRIAAETRHHGRYGVYRDVRRRSAGIGKTGGHVHHACRGDGLRVFRCRDSRESDPCRWGTFGRRQYTGRR